MAGRVPRRARPPGRAHALPRRPRRPGRLLPPALRAGGAVRAEPCVAPHRPLPPQPPLGNERNAARRAPHQLGDRGPEARLRPRALRLHRHESGSAHARPRASVPAHLRGPAARAPPGLHDGREPDPVGALAREEGLRGLRRAVAAPAQEEGRTRLGGRRPRPDAARVPRRAPRHVLHGRPGDRAPVGARRRSVVRPPLALPAAPALGRPRAVQRALRSGVPAGLRARGERGARSRAAPVAPLPPLARLLPRAGGRAEAAPVQGELLRTDDRGRRPARPPFRVARGAGPLGLDARRLHVRPRRADGRPLDARRSSATSTRATTSR